MGKSFSSEVRAILRERFGHDTLLSLATVDGSQPFVRTANAYYEDDAFYVITHALSNKMKQIAKNPQVAVCGDWFTAQGIGVNLGSFGKPENRELAETLRRVFASWIDNGHNDFSDENTCILCVRLTHGLLFSHGTRYDFDFTAGEA